MKQNGQQLSPWNAVQVRKLIDVINEATSAIPGWDDYAATGVAKQLWNGNFR